MSHRLDYRGLSCPMPLARLNRAIEPMASGETLDVVCDCPDFALEVRVWCERRGHRLRSLNEEEGLTAAVVEKG